MPSKMREKRFFKGIPQWEVAVGTGMSQARVSLIERGYVSPTDLDKQKIARVLKCKPEDIFPTEAK
jgi:transcriptional regulator with XRE-family HTH domain